MGIIALEINARQSLAGGRGFGFVGPYLQLDGTAHFAVDPGHPGNRCITDLDLAPRDSDGRVRFAADLRILTPEDQQRSNRRLLFDVVNRGNRLALAIFNRVPRPITPSVPLDCGDGFLMRHGYTVVWCGWQHDVPAVDGLMRIHVPDAQTAGGPVSGRLLVSFQPNAPGQIQLLSDRAHRAYPTSNLDDPEAMLLVRGADDTPPQAIPRGQWSFAKTEGGQVVPDAAHIYLAAGFVPGKVYHVIYTTPGAPVIGLGLLTARDIVAFLRHGTAQQDNPCAGAIERAYAFGASQSGRFLRQFLYLGLNEDEQERLVFDGLLVHIAGGKRGGDFNQRFGQPSASLQPNMSNLFPFSDTVQTDPVTGRTDGLLERLAARRQMPKIFFTNTSTEYWRGQCGTQQRCVVHGVEFLLAPSAVDRVGVGQRQRAGAMLCSGEVVDANRGGQSYVFRPLDIGVDQRGIDDRQRCPVFRRRVNRLGRIPGSNFLRTSTRAIDFPERPAAVYGASLRLLHAIAWSPGIDCLQHGVCMNGIVIDDRRPSDARDPAQDCLGLTSGRLVPDQLKMSLP